MPFNAHLRIGIYSEEREILKYMYEIHFMNLNDLKLKRICERIKIKQEFLNINHSDLYYQISSNEYQAMIAMVTTG